MPTKYSQIKVQPEDKDWEEPEGSGREGGGRGYQDGEHM